MHILECFLKTAPKIETKRRIIVFVSGGADSDIVIDVVSKLDPEKKVIYIFFNTGIEYQATMRHLDFLEQKYGIEIKRVRAAVPVPLGCKRYGQPFWSKFVSDMIYRLQKHGFKWEDKPLEELIKEYPQCRAALRWWCNFDSAKDGESWDNYRPIFWFLDEDKRQYEETFSILHSDCYRVYGSKRTGCAGCPFGRNFEQELAACKMYEPKLYEAIVKIFGDSYEYTRGFLRFRESQKQKAKSPADDHGEQIKIFE